VPDGVQGYDRFAYTANNPIRYNDPSGHCFGLVQCVNQVVSAAVFLAQRAISTGRLEDKDFVDAADAVAPAYASGSKESASFAGGFMATWIYSKSLITTRDGEVQVYNESDVNERGVPEGAALPGLGVSVTHGYVQGLESARDYEGGAIQGNLSVPLCEACGAYLEGYKADVGRVWGVDIGLEAGLAPTILGAAHTTARPTNNANGLIPNRLNGPQLLGCRLLSMCGASTQ
jgi:hypothetical protein